MPTSRLPTAASAAVLFAVFGYWGLGDASAPVPTVGPTSTTTAIGAEVVPANPNASVPSPLGIALQRQVQDDLTIVAAAAGGAAIRPPLTIARDGQLATRSLGAPDGASAGGLRRAPAPTAVVQPGATPDPAWARLAQAEKSYDAGAYRQALTTLDAGPLPADVADLVALRRAELALHLGDLDRARAELARPELVDTSNRILQQRAAQAAEQVDNNVLAAELWARSATQPTWSTERTRAMRNAALDFGRAGQADRAADLLALLADSGARSAQLGRDLRPLADLGTHHAGLVALIGGDNRSAAQLFRKYLDDRPNGDYAIAAQRRLASLGSTTGDTSWASARDADTAEAYDAWVQAHPSNGRVPEARFYQGLADYRDGRLSDALALWNAWTGPSAGIETRSRALYWSGKALTALGQVEAGRERWRTAAGLRPSSYYSVRSADRLNGITGWPDGGSAAPSGTTTAGEEAELDRWLNGWAGAPAPAADGDAMALRRAPLFASVGLERTATAELDRIIEATGNPRVVYQAGRIAQANGLWESSVRAGLRLGRMAPEKSSMDSPRAVRRLAYPSGYRDQVQAETARVELGPLLLLALMRQESLFDRFALSSADARGLTQVIPSTGADLAKAMGRAEFQPDDLYDPNLAVAFGARYLAGQLKAFGGDVFRAVAAYNAGGGAAAGWARGTDDPDVFVESIPYAETKGYVQSIYQYHAVYRGLLDRG